MANDFDAAWLLEFVARPPTPTPAWKYLETVEHLASEGQLFLQHVAYRPGIGVSAQDTGDTAYRPGYDNVWVSTPHGWIKLPVYDGPLGLNSASRVRIVSSDSFWDPLRTQISYDSNSNYYSPKDFDLQIYISANLGRVYKRYGGASWSTVSTKFDRVAYSGTDFITAPSGSPSTSHIRRTTSPTGVAAQRTRTYTSDSNFPWRGPWSRVAQYSRGDVVYFAGVFWVAIATTQLDVSPGHANAPSNWKLAADVISGNDTTNARWLASSVQSAKLSWDGPWHSGNHRYSANEATFDNNRMFVSTKSHNSTPTPPGDLIDTGEIISVPQLPALPARHYWSGIHDLTLAGQTWSALGNVLDVSDAVDNLGKPSQRFSFTLRATDSALRAALAVDRGPIEVVLRWAYRRGAGNWTLIPRTLRGRLSAGRLTEGAYVAELETISGDIATNIPKFWSHADQIREYPLDKGLSNMRALEAGLSIVWPQ